MTRLPPPPSNADQGADASDEPQSMSLLGGVARAEGLPEVDLDLHSMKGPSKLFSGTTLVILAVFAVAAAVLYTMKLTASDGGADAASQEVEAKIEQALAKLIAPEKLPANDPLVKKNMDDLFKDTDAIVAMFTEDMTQRQVPIEFVKKNPFALNRAAANPAAGAPATSRNDDRKLQRLNAELADLELQTIMLGARPVAVISSEIVRPGDRLGSFTVKEIRQFGVTLEAQGQAFKLEMQKPEDKSSGRGR